MQREWILGRQPVYEVLRAGRRQVFRLWIPVSKDQRDKTPLQGNGTKKGNVSPPLAEFAQGRLADILLLCKQRKIPVEQVPRPQLDGLGDGNQGVALQVSPYPYVDLYDVLEHAQDKEDPFLLILDTLQDPQNLGTLLRTAEVVGVHGVLLPLRRTVTVTPAVISASSGAAEHLNVAQCNLAQAIEALKKAGIWVVGLDAADDCLLPNQVDLNRPLALVVGSEGQGMRSLVRTSCDLTVRLPMRGKIASLNAASAGAVALYLAWQARGYV